MPKQNQQTLADFLEIEVPAQKEEVTPLKDFLEDKPAEVETEVEVEEEVDKIAEHKAPAQEKTEPTPEKEVAVKQPTFYTDMVRDFLEDGEWEDGNIEIEDENGETQTIQLSDLKDVNAALFKQIKAGQKALKEEELKANFVSVKGLDETTKKLIEAKKAGADIRGLIQYDADLVHPLKGYDVEDPTVQENLIRWNLTNRGEDADDIEYKIQKYKKNFILDTEAGKIVNIINADYDNKVTQTLEEQKKQNSDIIEAQKLFRKTTQDVYKGYKLTESLTKTLVDNAAKFDETGLTMADRAYFDAKNNPEFYAQVVFLLSDEKAFNEYKGVKIKNQVAAETIMKISKIPKQAANTAMKKENDGVDPLEKFFSK